MVEPITFGVRDLITIIMFLGGLGGIYWRLKHKVQRIELVKAEKEELQKLEKATNGKANRDDLLAAIETLGKEFNDTLKDLKTDINRATSEMVGSYHKIDLKAARLEVSDKQQSESLTLAWAEINKIKNQKTG